MTFFENLKMKRLKKQITGHYHNMVPSKKNGKQTEFCIKCVSWDTVWPIFKAHESFCCANFDEILCPNAACPQKAAHDEYIRLKNKLNSELKQKVK